MRCVLFCIVSCRDAEFRVVFFASWLGRRVLVVLSCRDAEFRAGFFASWHVEAGRGWQDGWWVDWWSDGGVGWGGAWGGSMKYMFWTDGVLGACERFRRDRKSFVKYMGKANGVLRACKRSFYENSGGVLEWVSWW